MNIDTKKILIALCSVSYLGYGMTPAGISKQHTIQDVSPFSLLMPDDMWKIVLEYSGPTLFSKLWAAGLKRIHDFKSDDTCTKNQCSTPHKKDWYYVSDQVMLSTSLYKRSSMPISKYNSDHSKRLIVGPSSAITLYDCVINKPVQVFNDSDFKTLQEASFNKAGDLFVTCHGVAPIKIWHVDSGQLLCAIKQQKDVTKVHFSQDEIGLVVESNEQAGHQAWHSSFSFQNISVKQATLLWLICTYANNNKVINVGDIAREHNLNNKELEMIFASFPHYLKDLLQAQYGIQERSDNENKVAKEKNDVQSHAQGSSHFLK